MPPSFFPAVRRTLLFTVLCVAGCRSEGRNDSSPQVLAEHQNETPEAVKEPPDALVNLRAYEAKRRASADFAHIPASHAAHGADPYRIAALPNQNGYVSILRGDHSLVWLDAELKEKARIPAPKSPSGLAVSPEGEVFVVGELHPFIARYQFQKNALVAAGTLPLYPPVAARDIAISDRGALYVVEEKGFHLFAFVPSGKIPGTVPANQDLSRYYKVFSHGISYSPLRIRTAGELLFVNKLLEHRISIFETDSKGVPEFWAIDQIENDGPFFGFDVKPFGDGFVIAAGGVENHKLDRSDGSFGYIDSFLFVYAFKKGERPKKLAEINVSEHGIITPKAIEIEKAQPGEISIQVSGFGGFQLGRAIFKGDDYKSIEVKTIAMAPGISDLISTGEGSWVAANPLLDTWMLGGKDSVRHVAAEQEPPQTPSDRRRLGEALFFTALMAPKNRTEGALSRFTCETCHFEGYIDGRTHHTGRGKVFATTKPLLGLFNNRPHFSRALDPDLSAVAHNEFRVAGAKSGHDPWFSIRVREYPWTERLLPREAWKEADTLELGPEELRLALMDFLMAFTHRPNPSVLGRNSFTELEKRGAELFKAKCESCHRARLSADDPASAVPFDQWEKYIFSEEGALVWASAEYQKTGIEPYMHERGTRTPSLRRLYKKHPFFTNGSAKDPVEVISFAHEVDGVFYHSLARGGIEPTWTTSGNSGALLAFLDLL